MVRRAVHLVVSVLAMAAPLIGCRDSDGPISSTEPTDALVASNARPDAAVSPAPTTSAPAPPTPPPPAQPVAPLSPLPPVPPPLPPAPAIPVVSDPPQTGVPGSVDSPFCGAYGTMVVTDYLVGLVEAFGDDSGARRAEVVAAPSFVAAYDAAVAALAEVGPTTDPFAERWSGYGDRARSVIETGVPVDELAPVWERVLSVHDRNDPTLEIELTSALSAAVDAAAVGLRARRGSLASDEMYRSLAVIATPDVDRYVAERCPEVAQATTGDAV